MADSQSSCPKCGLFNPTGAIICDCGYNLTTHRAGPLADTRAETIVRPWIRYWARMFDVWTWTMLIGFLTLIVAPDALSGASGDQLVGLLAVFGWVFMEALLLASWGTTPGKWLFRIEIVPPATGSLSYKAALRRSFKVWYYALGS